MLCNREGDYAGSIEVLTRILEAHGPLAPILSERAYAKTFLGDDIGAIGDCSEALDVQPNFIPALQTRMRLYRRIGREDLAQQDKNTLDGYRNTGTILSLMEFNPEE